ncbi:MAG TPA: alpha/beta fold hydrolase [Propionicimonas sp.]|uniref:alpha/beta hydrolase n=1 Tax=Propionicimonas sp. TaxID=1955623 RepID=UPI002F3EB26F
MKRFLGILGGSLLALVVLLALVTFTSITDPYLAPHPHATTTYAAATAGIQAVAATEATMDLQPEGHSIAMLTGAPSAKAVVIFHGYTVLPEQFRLIGAAYLAQGYNVWIPRLPHHGMSDRMTDEFSRITATELRDFVDASVDIGAGLGDELTVIGISGGGSLGVLAGFERPEVDHTVLLTPLLHPLGYEEWQDRPLVRALRLSPVDVWNWWSDEQKEKNVQGYDYPRFSLKGIAGLLSMFQWTDAQNKAPAHSTFTLVRNDGDPRIDGAFNERFLTRLVPEGRIGVVVIPASAGLGHDLVSWQHHSENYTRLTESYAYLSQALGIPIADPKAG